MSRRRATILVAAAIVLLASARADAYCRKTTCDPAVADCALDDRGCVRDGAVLHWGDGPIVYRFHSGGTDRLERNDEARKAIRAAFHRWSDVLCDGRRTSLRFEEHEDATGRLRGRMEPFTLYFRDEQWRQPRGHHTLALTTHDHGVRTGLIASANVEINTMTTSFGTRDDVRDAVDLEAVMTHEAGHYIGLAHSDDPDSIMVATYCASKDRCSGSLVEARRLSADDERAVCALFPPDGPPTFADETPEAPSCTASPRAASSLAAPASAALTVLLLAMRRRGTPPAPRHNETAEPALHEAARRRSPEAPPR